MNSVERCPTVEYLLALQGAALEKTWDEAWRVLGRRVPAQLLEQFLQAWLQPHCNYHDLAQ